MYEKSKTEAFQNVTKYIERYDTNLFKNCNLSRMQNF